MISEEPGSRERMNAMILGMTLLTGFLALLIVVGIIWLIACVVVTAARIFFHLAGLLILLPLIIILFTAVF
jgi:hypothetical protein